MVDAAKDRSSRVVCFVTVVRQLINLHKNRRKKSLQEKGEEKAKVVASRRRWSYKQQGEVDSSFFFFFFRRSGHVRHFFDLQETKKGRQEKVCSWIGQIKRIRRRRKKETYGFKKVAILSERKLKKKHIGKLTSLINSLLCYGAALLSLPVNWRASSWLHQADFENLLTPSASPKRWACLHRARQRETLASASPPSLLIQ